MSELIVVIVNQGYEETVMSAAREAGARGGTIFNARGTADAQDLVKFMGITLHPNKEIVFILATKSSRNKIMTAIKDSCGLSTTGAGIIFSLPVDSTMGVTLKDEPEEASDGARNGSSLSPNDVSESSSTENN